MKFRFSPFASRLLASLAFAVLLGMPRAAGAAAAAAPGAPDSALAVYDGGEVLPHEFTVAWWRLSPDQRPPGDALKSRQTFLSQIVDRKLLAREVKTHHYTLTPEEIAEVERTRDALAQNALFDHMVRDLPPPTEAELDAYKRQLTTLAEVRFVTFADWNKARSWRQRLSTGTPISALDAAILRDGSAFATADTFRFVAAADIPDTLAKVIWAMRPGQTSDIHSFAGEPTVILVRRFTPRATPPSLTEPSALRLDYQRRTYDRIRQRYRVDLAERVHRTFVEDALAILLRAHLLIPPRNDVDSVSGLPVVRPNIPVPTLAPADTARTLVRVRDRAYTIGNYLAYWGRVQPYGRPEIRERGSLEAAIDRMALADEILRSAREQGLDRTPAVLETVARQREGFELDHYFADEIQSKVRVTDAALRKLWASDPKHYDDRASIESHIILVDRKSLADSLLARLRNGASFGDLAKEYSMEGQSAAEGGKAGMQYRGSQTNAGLEDAMFATSVGQLGGPEKTPEGWVLWRIDAATPGVTRTFAQAKPMLERDFRVIEADRLLSNRLEVLRKSAHVRLFPERVTTELGSGGPWDE